MGNQLMEVDRHDWTGAVVDTCCCEAPAQGFTVTCQPHTGGTAMLAGCVYSTTSPTSLTYCSSDADCPAPQEDPWCVKGTCSGNAYSSGTGPKYCQWTNTCQACGSASDCPVEACHTPVCREGYCDQLITGTVGCYQPCTAGVTACDDGNPCTQDVCSPSRFGTICAAYWDSSRPTCATL